MKIVKLSGDAEQATQTKVETMEITKKLAASWKSPPFQRELRYTAKVAALTQEVNRTGVLPGVITLGVLDGEVWKVDGQHRIHAGMMSDCVVFYADVRTHFFQTMGEMADEFLRVNGSLVRIRQTTS